MLPLDYQGSMRTPNPVGGLEDIRRRISSALGARNTANVRVEEHAIYFKVRKLAMFGSRFDPLLGIDSGQISLEQHPAGIEIGYTVKVDRTLSWVILGILIFAIGYNTLGPGRTQDIPTYFLFAVIGWLWLVGGGALISHFKFKRLLNRALVNK